MKEFKYLMCNIIKVILTKYW